MITRDRVRGMFLGIAIGDALGMPVEMMSFSEIKARHGRLMRYVDPPADHKFHGKTGLTAGMWTDDTQLTIAVAESLIEAGKINLDSMSEWHIKAFKESVSGWGKGSRNAIQKLIEGIHWSESGTSGASGNGVAMKISPIGAYCVARESQIAENDTRLIKRFSECNSNAEKIERLCKMTHGSRMALVSGFSQVQAIKMCLTCSSSIYFKEIFMNQVISICNEHEGFKPRDEDSLYRHLKEVFLVSMSDYYKDIGLENISKLFPGNPSYVYNSLPLTYLLFLKNSRSIESLYDAVNVGGDTDTNASILGAMLGALNGTKIFPKHLIDGLWRREEIINLANRFCDKFNISEEGEA